MKKLNRILNSRTKKILFIFFVVLLIVIVFFGYTILASRTGVAIFCVFHKITGLYCPGCGVTRSLASFANLDIYQAFRYNELIFVAGPLILYYYFNKVYYWIFSKTFKDVPKYFWGLVLFIAIVFGILRNIPGFEYLQPTKIR